MSCFYHDHAGCNSEEEKIDWKYIHSKKKTKHFASIIPSSQQGNKEQAVQLLVTQKAIEGTLPKIHCTVSEDVDTQRSPELK